MRVLYLDELSRRFGEDVVVGPVTATLGRGEITGLFGPNGSGKSTLLRMIVGLERPTSGTISRRDTASGEGKAISANDLRKLTVFVQDTPALYDYLSIRENVAFACAIWGADITQTCQRLTRYGVSANLHTLVKDLSLGTKKKIGYVLATLKQSPLLVLDEPFNGLDAETVEVVVQDLVAATEQGRTVLLTPHDDQPVQELLDQRIHLASSGVLPNREPKS